jgi:hypothetical protein
MRFRWKLYSVNRFIDNNGMIYKIDEDCIGKTMIKIGQLNDMNKEFFDSLDVYDSTLIKKHFKNLVNS